MFEEAIALSPVNFFQLRLACKKALTPLPDLSDLCGDESFAKVAMGWSLEGLDFEVEVEAPIERPAIENGDSIDLFIDTRDVKSSGYNTRFCHHFYFLPEAVDGKQAGEITKFRTDDRHDWCDPGDLQIKVKKLKKGYTAKIHIPAQCLQGYDPQQYARIGFTYRINRYGELSQHFSVDTADYQIEQQPSLWSSIELVE